MAAKPLTKGKKRAYGESSTERSSSSPSPIRETVPVKKPKRAETRPCPVCDEPIPLRLLAKHAVLELERVEQIIKSVGSTQVMGNGPEEGSSKDRRSAVKARKCLSALNPRTDPNDSLELSSKAIQTIKRHRKQRYSKLRDMTRDEEDDGKRRVTLQNGGTGEIVCPLCLQTLRGDQDVMEAHVESCLAYETNRLREEQERQREAEAEVWEGLEVNGTALERVTDEASFRGTGISMRDRNVQDIDGEVDIDGDDEEVFGDVQFTEGDILGPSNDPQPEHDCDEDVNVDEDNAEQTTLQDMGVEGRVFKQRLTLGEGVKAGMAKTREVMAVGNADKTDLAISLARTKGSSKALITALVNKIKQLESARVSGSTSLLCRICLDPYAEPTASTGCWHTCCRECWLRCLGSTKLCPICKRITAATELRRIYL